MPEVLPGALVCAVVLEASFQVLPIYLRLAGNATAVKAFAGPALLLLWLYLMANVIVFGSEINYWLARRVDPGGGSPGISLNGVNGGTQGSPVGPLLNSWGLDLSLGLRSGKARLRPTTPACVIRLDQAWT